MDKQQKLGDLISGIKTAMLTTIDAEGHLHSRPMAMGQKHFNGELWFLTQADSPKISELSRDARVNLSFADPGKDIYVSISGHAEIVKDRMKAEELWSPAQRAWFPKGVDDPNLVLLRVKIEQAQYWDPPAGKMVMLGKYLKAVVTGEPAADHANKKLDLTG